MINNLKIAYLSCHFSGAIKLDYLLTKKLKPVSIITISQKLAALNKISGFFDFNQLAKKNNIEVYCVKSFNLKDTQDINFFSNSNFDLLLISGWQRLIPEQILRTLKIGAVGEHGSSEYLPRGRGRSPINWSIIQGRNRFILHLYMANSSADSGKIIDKTSFVINKFDNVYSIYTKMALCSGQMFVNKLPELINKSWRPIKTAKIDPNYFDKRTLKNDFINWNNSTEEIYNHVRATTRPYPGAKSKIGSQIIIIWSAQPYDLDFEDFDKKFGEVTWVFPNKEFLVKTIDGTLIINEYEYPTKVKKGDLLR